MACKNGEIISAVKAPNGKPSLLYASLLKVHKGDQSAAFRSYLMTETEQFKAWFAEGGVRDDNGEPLVVWHGAQQAKPTGNSFDKGALFFSDNYDYAAGTGLGDNLTPTYIRTRKMLNSEGNYVAGSTVDSVEELGMESSPDWINPNRAKKAGFDSIKGRDFAQNEGNSYILFDRYNAKAVKNSGLFTEGVNLFDALTEDEMLAEEVLTEMTDEMLNDQKLEGLSDLLANQKIALERRAKVLENSINDRRLNTKQRMGRRESHDELVTLLKKIEELDEKQAFIELVKYSQTELRKINEFLTSKFDPKNPLHDLMLVQINQQMETFGGLRVHEFAKNNSKLANAIRDINSLYNQINMVLPQKTEDYMVAVISANSTNKEELGTEEDIRKYLREGKDIDFMSSQFGDTSSSVDAILAITDKIRKRKLEEIREANEEFESKVLAAGRKLRAAGVTGYEWMLKLTDGANFIERIGARYKETRKRLQDATKDDDGNPLQYHKGTLMELTDEEKQWNISLSQKKKELTSFLRPEFFNKEANELQDGLNHKYSVEFKLVRDKYQIRTKGKFGPEWIMRPGIDEAEYEEFLRTYYSPEREVWVMDTEETFSIEGQSLGFEPTGQVVPVKMRFVREQFVEIQDIWNEDAYEALRKDNSPEGIAKREFYDFYVEEYGKLLNKLPVDIGKSMKGKIFRIRTELAKQATSKGVGFFRAFLKSIKSLVTPDILTSGRLLDENGHAVNDIGLFYVGDIYNQDKIDKLEARLAVLKGTVVASEIEEAKKITRSLKIEKNKPKVEELEVDLVKSLIQGGKMVEHYDQMKQIEGTMLLAKEMLSKKNFFKTDAKGVPVLDKDGNPQYKLHGDALAVKRFDTYLRMIFYSNSEKNNSAVAQIAKNFQKFTSMKLQGLNPFSAINNAVTAGVNQVIEAKGGQFYNTEQYARATKIFMEFLKDDIWKRKRKTDVYSNQRQFSKLDAMVHHFGFMQQGAERANKLEEGKTTKEYIKSLDWLYVGIEIGEFQAQVRSAIAKMINTPVTLADGTVSNVWDAHDFVDGKIVLKQGAVFSKNDKYDLTNEIKNMNKFIHGNYNPEDRVPIQEHWLGELALQFKKWMFNSVRSRFGGKYYDEGIAMETEGRYRALLRFYQGLQIFGFDKYKEYYKTMTPADQAAMRKNIAELGYFMTTVALLILFDAMAGLIPPDDEKLLAAVNFLKKQADRSRGEITFWSPTQVFQSLKTPVAGLRVIQQAAEFMGAATMVPVNLVIGDGEDNFYDRGVNKGELKAKQKLMNVVPILQLGAQFEQLYVSGNFFIK